MRQMIKTILSVLFLIMINTAHGQNTLEYRGQGINDTTHYTYQNIIDKWGVPNSYKSHDSELGLTEEYNYNSNIVSFRENGILDRFYIISSEFSVIWGGVILRVGDNESKIHQIPNSKIENPEIGYFRIWLYDYNIRVVTKNNVINSIGFTDPL